MITFAVYHEKGGVGKTTTATNLAADLARLGYRTGLIDCSPQGHGTFGVGVDAAGAPTLADVLGDAGQSLASVLRETRFPRLFVVPADSRLDRAARFLRSCYEPAMRLQRELVAVADALDCCVIDCPPGNGLLALNALSAATHILIPMPLDAFALVDLKNVLDRFYAMTSKPSACEWRILVTMASGRGQERQATALRYLEPVRERILNTPIRRSESIPRSQMGTPLPVVLDSRPSRGRRDYRALVKEVVKWAMI